VLWDWLPLKGNESAALRAFHVPKICVRFVPCLCPKSASFVLFLCISENPQVLDLVVRFAFTIDALRDISSKCFSLEFASDRFVNSTPPSRSFAHCIFPEITKLSVFWWYKLTASSNLKWFTPVIFELNPEKCRCGFLFTDDFEIDGN